MTDGRDFHWPCTCSKNNNNDNNNNKDKEQRIDIYDVFKRFEKLKVYELYLPTSEEDGTSFDPFFIVLVMEILSTITMSISAAFIVSINT